MKNKKTKQRELRDNGNNQGVEIARGSKSVFISETSDRRQRRYQKMLERRRQQRARRREALEAARRPREADDEIATDSTTSATSIRRKGHQSNRQARRQRQRATLRRSQRNQQHLKTLIQAVSHFGGTLEEEPRLADDGTADAREDGNYDQVTDQLEKKKTGWVAVRPKDVPSCATRGVDDGILLVVPVQVYGKTL